MKPVDYRTESWNDIQARITGLRFQVWNALKLHGPCTTRELAERSGIDILTVRPRVTELHQIGHAICLDAPGPEGRYRAATYAEARHHFDQTAQSSKDQQLQLL